jgi:hypothetical protein
VKDKFGNSRLIYEEDMKKRVKCSRPQEVRTNGRWYGNFLARPIRSWCNVGGKLITCPCINVPVIQLKNKRCSNPVTTLSFHPSPPNRRGRNRIPPPQTETAALSLSLSRENTTRARSLSLSSRRRSQAKQPNQASNGGAVGAPVPHPRPRP